MSILITVIVDLIGWTVVAAPWIVIYSTGTYQEIALWVTYVAYGILITYGIAYLFGSLKCLRSTAAEILLDVKKNDVWYSYIPVMALIACSIAATYKSMYVIAVITILPLVIIQLSRMILKFKANKV